ncbi:MAG: isoprenyl transferase [Filifactoraceae bacterium]
MIDSKRVPNHIGIIMDGNGRWAKRRFLPRTAGHKEGVETLRKIIEASIEIKVPYLTVYAFSTENWKRSMDEVGALMMLLEKYLESEGGKLHKEGVRLRAIGDMDGLPKNVYKKLKEVEELTSNNEKLNLTLALNYGARDDIKQAIVKIIKADRNKPIDIEKIDDEFLRDYLSTKFLPDPDLIIRPSGEYRLSNFLMWESAYSEFWFSDINWPDFTEENFYKAIESYQQRDRRFGGVK